MVFLSMYLVYVCCTLWYGFETYLESLIYSKIEIQNNWKIFNVGLIFQRNTNLLKKLQNKHYMHAQTFGKTHQQD
jgi:hypothetical protein